MKKKATLTFAVCLVACLFSSCATKIVDRGFQFSVYIDYDAIRNYGFEVLETEIPAGTKAIGSVSEYVRFTRVYTKTANKAYDDTYDLTVPKYDYKVDGNIEGDQQKIVQRIAQLIREKNGKGIANLKVKTSLLSDNIYNPEFYISGTIYR